MDNVVTVSFKLNGRMTALAVSPLTSLRDALREHLHMTGTKAGCGQGGCGSCTILLDGEPTLSCLMPLALVDGREVSTVEGFNKPGELHPLQQSFYDHFAAQCGYCTSGMILSAKALLDENPSPTREEIAEALSGNLCRCTGYVPIFEAIEAVTQQKQEA